MACGDIHSVHHDNLWPLNIYRHINSESYLKSGSSSKTAHSCNAEFMASF